MGNIVSVSLATVEVLFGREERISRLLDWVPSGAFFGRVVVFVIPSRVLVSE